MTTKRIEMLQQQLSRQRGAFYDPFQYQALKEKHGFQCLDKLWTLPQDPFQVHLHRQLVELATIELGLTKREQALS
jgi:hypothetical protein